MCTAAAAGVQAVAIMSNDTGGDTESCEQFCELGVAVRVQIGTLDIDSPYSRLTPPDLINFCSSRGAALRNRTLLLVVTTSFTRYQRKFWSASNRSAERYVA